MNQELIRQNAQVGTEQATITHAVDAVANVASQHEGAALIIASAIATSIIIYAVAKSAAELIEAWRGGK